MIPAWFDARYYFTSKLQSLQKHDASYTKERLEETLLTVGFIGDEGLYQHFVLYGQYEDVSPNIFFDPILYYTAKATDFYNISTITQEQYNNIVSAIHAFGLNAWSHYSLYGWHEGLNPSNRFDTQYYLQLKLTDLQKIHTTFELFDLIHAFTTIHLNPIEHYYMYGIQENFISDVKILTVEDPIFLPSLPSPLWFENDYYFSSLLQQLQTTDFAYTEELLRMELQQTGYDYTNLYTHFIDIGQSKDIAPNVFFDPAVYYGEKAAFDYKTQLVDKEQYYNTYSTLQQAGLNAWSHYSMYGWHEGVNPSTNFDTQTYLELKLADMQKTNPEFTLSELIADFVVADLNPVEHYLLFGIHEGFIHDESVLKVSDAATVLFLKENTLDIDIVGIQAEYSPYETEGV